jgi:hypothetical protein
MFDSEPLRMFERRDRVPQRVQWQSQISLGLPSVHMITVSV